MKYILLKFIFILLFLSFYLHFWIFMCLQEYIINMNDAKLRFRNKRTISDNDSSSFLRNSVLQEFRIPLHNSFHRFAATSVCLFHNSFSTLCSERSEAEVQLSYATIGENQVDMMNENDPLSTPPRPGNFNHDKFICNNAPKSFIYLRISWIYKSIIKKFHFIFLT